LHRLREVARSLFESAKAGDVRLLGENAIGLLAYQQLGGRCEIVSLRTARLPRRCGWSGVRLLDYLATLVAKEYVVYNNPRATADDLGEELVRMLIRVRRHLPRRR
jgi:hypothetical protein